MTPPIANRIPKTLTAHGNTRTDDYFWLRDRDNPEVIEYLEAENAHTAAVMASESSLTEEINREILSRIQQTDQTVPARRGAYFYYSRTVAGRQYPLYCRTRGSEGAEEVMLDINELARGKEYFALGALAVSENDALLGFSTDENGSEEYTVRIKNLHTGAMLPDVIPDTSPGLVWANDGRTFFYVTFDETKRPEKVRRHLAGRDAVYDEVVFTETDRRFTFEIGKTRSRKFLVVSSINASKTSETLLLDADHPEGSFRVFEPRQTGVEYYVDHQGDRFLVRTNADGAARFKLMETPAAATARTNWRALVPEHAEATLDEVEAFEGHAVLHTRENALPNIRVMNRATGAIHALEFAEPAYTVALGDNFEYRTGTLRFAYSSLVTPYSVFDYDIAARTRVLLKQTEVPGGFHSADYTTERLYAPAVDGKRVPVSIVYRGGFQRNGRNPLLLYGYGSYGLNTDAKFTASYLSLLDRGFAVALAHVRGGAEYGREWFENGRMLNKRNSFTDFVACAEYLIAERYTSAACLSAMGGSAGGLLMGAVINLRPELFRSVVAMVPFVDVVTTMLDASIPLTTGEYDQWGNPSEKVYYDYMKTYSPYDNVERKAYPNLLVTTGLNDPRVAYWEPAKWVARLRALKTDGNLLLLKTQMGAGHGGPSGRYEKYRETAFIYAFLLKTAGQGCQT
ncbi:MAG: S9 family peptidase [Acidobacteriota bacterium]|nr:S9 family peptidase [Acidobacteriota bacterium]